jgi:hypothetical protein
VVLMRTVAGYRIRSRRQDRRSRGRIERANGTGIAAAADALRARWHGARNTTLPSSPTLAVQAEYGDSSRKADAGVTSAWFPEQTLPTR